MEACKLSINIVTISVGKTAYQVYQLSLRTASAPCLINSASISKAMIGEFAFSILNSEISTGSVVQ